ncbi:MAG: GTPase ObgE [Firmicutes bacterium]|nr:GTPase ObgE [Bacillota bacterium]
MFIDKAHIIIRSGKGGNGCVSFRREPFVPDGGPDGGDGGRGGDVIFLADNNLRTLMDFRYKRKYEAEDGEDGRKKKQFGKGGQDLVIKVPPGTVIIEEESGLVMCDLAKNGDTFVAAKGGRGGKGNVNFKTPVRQAPNFAEAGGFAVERKLILELKLLADVGLVGFPNVGKSNLLYVATRAAPKIANYHFTTLTPNLGVVQMYDTSFVMADIPGLIEGASEGAGLGLDFLKHIQRTRVLLHLVDVSGSEGRDPLEDFDIINKELATYGQKVMDKPQLVVASKMDLATEEQYEAFKTAIEARGYKVFPLSAPIHQGVKELIAAAASLLAELPPEEEPDYEYYDFSKEMDLEEYRRIDAEKVGRVYVLKGRQLEKIFNSTNFNDGGSLRYLYKHIEKHGGLEKLKKLGLQEGDTIRVFDYEFEYFEE